MEKKCNKCNVVKDVSGFYKDKANKDGFRNDCIICRKEKVNSRQYKDAHKEKKKERNERYRKNNKEIVAIKAKQYREANKDKSKQYREANKDKLKEYREDNKEKLKEYHIERYKVNKERLDNYASNYRKSRRKTDSLYNLTLNTRRAIARYLNGAKSKRTKEIIGIDYKEFQDYLEVEYTENMHLDHIIPQSWAINEDEVYILNHYSNFQIITAEDNIAKSDSYCKSENLKKVLDNHNDLTKLNKIIERNSDKIK